MKLMAQRSWQKSEPLALMELPTPEPAPDGVRVAVRAIGVNPVDWKMREKGPLRLAARLLGPPPPVVIGVDFACVVDAVGTRVRHVAVGDRVVGGTNFARRQRGFYADTVLVREDQLCKLPPAVDLESAGALPVAGVTAWISLAEIGRLQPGQKALVLGASGGVGHIAVQLAKQALQGFVVGVCSAKNAAFVRGLGADVVLDYGEGDALEQARAHGPYQVLMDCVGSYPSSRCRSLLVRGGRPRDRERGIRGLHAGALGAALLLAIRTRTPDPGAPRAPRRRHRRRTAEGAHHGALRPGRRGAGPRAEPARASRGEDRAAAVAGSGAAFFSV